MLPNFYLAKLISIHSLVRGRTHSRYFFAHTRDFNPLPRKRENGIQFLKAVLYGYFNPLPRKRENAAERLRKETSQKDFNPLPRKRENLIIASSTP